jgi:hypothetical protein
MWNMHCCKNGMAPVPPKSWKYNKESWRTHTHRCLGTYKKPNNNGYTILHDIHWWLYLKKCRQVLENKKWSCQMSEGLCVLDRKTRVPKQQINQLVPTKRDRARAHCTTFSTTEWSSGKVQLNIARPRTCHDVSKTLAENTMGSCNTAHVIFVKWSLYPGKTHKPGRSMDKKETWCTTFTAFWLHCLDNQQRQKQRKIWCMHKSTNLYRLDGKPWCCKILGCQHKMNKNQ